MIIFSLLLMLCLPIIFIRRRWALFLTAIDVLLLGWYFYWVHYSTNPYGIMAVPMGMGLLIIAWMLRTVIFLFGKVIKRIS